MFLAVNGMKTTGYSSGDANKKKSPENKEFSKKKKKTLLEDLQKMAARRSTRRSTAISSLATNNALIPIVTMEEGSASEISANYGDENDNTCNLFLECEEEPLSTAQQNVHAQKVKQFTEQMTKLENLASRGARITAQGDGSIVFRNTDTSTTTMSGNNPTRMSNMPQQPSMTMAGSKPTNNYRLLMDPRTGRILGTINGTGSMPANVPPGASTLIRAPAPPSVRLQAPTMNRMPLPVMPNPRLVPAPPRPHPVSTAVRLQSSVKPAQVVDLTRSSTAAVGASNAIANQTKSKFPALMVHPKPQDSTANQRRPELDQKVKSLLVLPPAKLTEWLIQQGLVPQEQTEHGQKLKLGMYSDSKKFPNSGGYVWLSDDSRAKYVSVFKGSLFETIIQPPNVLIKLIYHWTCQTSLNNVMTWVKVDHVTVDTFFRHMRCICIATVQEEVVNLGGDDKPVELGVISLGTTTTDGNRREVKVEVLGVLDRSTGKMRLRATEPIGGASQAERFARIFRPLPTWIRRDSRIIADFSVDRERLINMGYTNVFQCSAGANAKRADNTNATIMEYLKKVVPRMFQNSLSMLPTIVIQQFLDELTFREVFGKGPLACFDGIIQKIAVQTVYATKKNSTMSTRLRTLSDNPMGDWRISYQQQQMPLAPMGIDALPPSLRRVDSPGVQQQQQYTGFLPTMKRGGDFDMDIDREITKKMRNTPTVDLETYYYGTVEGDIAVLVSEFKADMAFKCHLCKRVFMNNIEFMKHLSLHVENERATAIDLADLSQCKYCLKDFESSFNLQKHVDEEHYKTANAFVCRICNESFGIANHLIHHMNRSHVRSELPYSCQVCGYRTSIHREIVDHFTEAHDRTDKLQCPRCLKTFSLFSDKGYNSSMAAAFVEHLQTHQDGKRIACKKCCLSFKDEKKLKGHLDRDHASFKGYDGLESYQYLANDTPLKMPRPDERTLKLAPKNIGAPKMGQVQQSAFAAQNLEDLAMYDVDRDDGCLECGRKLTVTGHYNAYLCCTKCRYSSCCSKALSIHVTIFHGPRQPIYELGVPSLLDKNVFCVCGFTTHSGNKMAKHLAISGCRSAYPTLEEAQKAAKPIFESDEAELQSFDPNEVMAKAYMIKKPEEARKKPEEEQPGPLAFLGLQKKASEEAIIEKTNEAEVETAGATEDKSEQIEKDIATDEKSEGTEKDIASDEKSECTEKDIATDEKSETTEKDIATDEKSDTTEKEVATEEKAEVEKDVVDTEENNLTAQSDKAMEDEPEAASSAEEMNAGEKQKLAPEEENMDTA